MPADVEPPQAADAAATARYAAFLLGELIRLSEDARLDLLVYLLEMARAEALSVRGTDAEAD